MALDRLAQAGLLLDDYTFRSAATAQALRFVPERGEPIEGHDDRPARGVLLPLAAATPPMPITLVALAKPADAGLARLLSQIAPAFAEVIVVFDSEADAAHGAPLPANARAICQPLTRFDAARNAAQDALRTAFALHLDTDETVDPSALLRLPALAELADAAALDAVGFPRRNEVDGVLSDLYPDVQYRLVRRTVRFEGAVHERPDACADWPRTMVSQTMAIRHHLDRARVLARRRRYDALGQSVERHAEATALLTPFTD